MGDAGARPELAEAASSSTPSEHDRDTANIQDIRASLASPITSRLAEPVRGLSSEQLLPASEKGRKPRQADILDHHDPPCYRESQEIPRRRVLQQSKYSPSNS